MSDRCGYPAGQEHPHVEQCHRAEREQVLAQVEALVEAFERESENARQGAVNAAEANSGIALAEWDRERFIWRQAKRRLRALVAKVREGAER